MDWDDVVDRVSKEGLKTEAEARDYFRCVVPDGLLDEIVVRLVEQEIVEPGEKESPYKEIYKKAMAQFFRKSRPMTEKDMVMKMSFELDWFTFKDAKTFLGYCKSNGLITERDGKLQPAFDVESVDLPLDWSIHEALGIKTGKQVAMEKKLEREYEQSMKMVHEDMMKEQLELLSEDGMAIDDESGDGDDDNRQESMTKTFRAQNKRQMVKKIMDIGMSVKQANGVFDYYELNKGIIDKGVFIDSMTIYEEVRSADILGEVYGILEKEACFEFRKHPVTV